MMKVRIDNATLSESLGDKGLFRSANLLQIADVVRLHAVLAMFFRQFCSVEGVKYSAKCSAILF